MDKRVEQQRAEEVERGRMRAAELSWALRAANRAASDLDRAFAAHLGMRSLDYDAMDHIMDAEHDPLGTVELGARLGISAGSATELVDRLERAGHVERRRGDHDRRRVRLTARPDSVQRILGELGPLFDDLDGLADEFSPRERQAIERYLRGAVERLVAHAERFERGAAPSGTSA